MRVVLRVSLPYRRRKTPEDGARDRRRHPRYPIGGVGKLYWETWSGETQIAQALLHNWSKRGLQIEVPHQVPVGAWVHVVSQQGGCLGVARYCLVAGEQYQVGIKVSQWFQP